MKFEEDVFTINKYHNNCCICMVCTAALWVKTASPANKTQLNLLLNLDKFNVPSVNETAFSGLCYKPITIIDNDSSIVNKHETSLIDDARVVIYDRHMFKVQAKRSLIIMLHCLHILVAIK
jgi:hypothetical protein